MDWLNYHHLLYFYTVAKEGSVSRAAATLRLAQPTLSGQIRKLEDAFDEKLFVRAGRRLVLSEMGRVVYRYADEIFSIGRELTETLRGRPSARPGRLSIGVADVVPKLITHRLLTIVLDLPEPVHVMCHEGKADRLLADLAVHDYDLVITDSPTTLRRSLDSFFQEHGVRPRVLAEFEDSALLKVFGQHGHGVFPAPTVIEGEVSRQYGVRVVGRTSAVVERFFGISIERRIKHPAVAAITQAARDRLFGRGAS
jgi:LysR family transcriptional activator of nhaA